jgi:hypothetical protein
VSGGSRRERALRLCAGFADLLAVLGDWSRLRTGPSQGRGRECQTVEVEWRHHEVGASEPVNFEISVQSANGEIVVVGATKGSAHGACELGLTADEPSTQTRGDLL